MSKELKDVIMGYLVEEKSGDVLIINPKIKKEISNIYNKIKTSLPDIFPAKSVISHDNGLIGFSKLHPDASSKSTTFESDIDTTVDRDPSINKNLVNDFKILYCTDEVAYNDGYGTVSDNNGFPDGIVGFQQNPNTNEAYPAAILLVSSDEFDTNINNEDNLDTVIDVFLHELCHVVQAKNVGYEENYWNTNDHHGEEFKKAIPIVEKATGRKVTILGEYS